MMMNTIKIVYQRENTGQPFLKRVLRLSVILLGATIISWSALLMIYETVCMIGKHTSLDASVIRAGLHAEHTVTMKYRTTNQTLNLLIHETEEMKIFYSRL